MFSNDFLTSMLSLSRRSVLRRKPRNLGGLSTASVVLGLTSLGWAGIAPPQYNVIDLTALAGSDSGSANSINNSGQVVGGFQASNTQFHAFVYSAGTLHDLGTFGGTYAGASAINQGGAIAGGATLASNPNISNALVYQNGAVQALPTPPGMSSNASGINGSGDVVGEFGPQQPANAYHAFLYSGGTMQDLGTFGGRTSWARGINNAGQVVGSADTADSWHAFLYSGGQMQDLGTLGGNSSTAFAIDSHGNVVGVSAVVTNPPDTYIHEHAFLDSNGVMTDLGTLGTGSSAAYDINENGQIVGASYYGPGADSRAFLYQDGTMYDLNALLTSDPGFVVGDALSINDGGQIVGLANMPDGSIHGVLLTPAFTPAAVPLLPAAWTGLSTIALLAGVIAMRKRGRARFAWPPPLAARPT
jgi:probable HAF family extracellular repeat protein